MGFGHQSDSFFNPLYNGQKNKNSDFGHKLLSLFVYRNYLLICNESAYKQSNLKCQSCKNHSTKRLSLFSPPTIHLHHNLLPAVLQIQKHHNLRPIQKHSKGCQLGKVVLYIYSYYSFLQNPVDQASLFLKATAILPGNCSGLHFDHIISHKFDSCRDYLHSTLIEMNQRIPNFPPSILVLQFLRSCMFYHRVRHTKIRKRSCPLSLSCRFQLIPNCWNYFQQR